MSEAILEVNENKQLLIVKEPNNGIIVQDVNTDILAISTAETALHVPLETVKILSIGTQGPAGPSAVTDSHYVHTQIAALTTWTVTHNLNKHPSVMVVDSGDNVVIGEVHYLGLNSLEITFSVPFGGKAYIN